MTRVRPIDIHAHFFPDAFLRLIGEEGERMNARVDRSDARGPVLQIGATRTAPLRAGFIDIDHRLKEMKRQGVGMHALSLTGPMVHWAPPEFGARLARAFNDAVAEAHTAHPDRFVGLATLPIQDPKLAVNEIDRIARLPGMRGVYLPTNVQGRELSHPDFFPLYERIHELGLPVFLHPVVVIGADRFHAFYLSNLLGHPFDNTIAAANLIFGGVLDRFPKLTVCLPHGGGAFPYLVGRLDRGWKMRAECKHLKRPPSAYLRRFTYDTITHSAESLRFLIKRVGADRVLLGSDYCFDMGYERPVEIVTKLAGLAKADQARILGGNAQRMLHLT